MKLSKMLFLLGMLLFVMLVGACSDDEPAGTSYEYTVTSANFFPAGVQVATVRASITGLCSAPAGVNLPLTRVGSGTVTTPGTVSYSFRTEITSFFVESVYIDNNASGNLDSGDRVWGDNPNDFAGACFDSLTSPQAFDWEVIAEQIRIALGNAVASVTYTGGAQAFLSGQAPGISAGAQIVNGGAGGYEGL